MAESSKFFLGFRLISALDDDTNIRLAVSLMDDYWLIVRLAPNDVCVGPAYLFTATQYYPDFSRFFKSIEHDFQQMNPAGANGFRGLIDGPTWAAIFGWFAQHKRTNPLPESFNFKENREKAYVLLFGDDKRKW